MTFERTMQIASRLIEMGGFFIADEENIGPIVL
jgi:hypothetical protein